MPDDGTVFLLSWFVAIPLFALAAALISIRIITKLLKESWGRVLVGIVFVALLAACASLALRAHRADETASNFNDACRYAMDLAQMHRFDSQRKSASLPERFELELRLLDSCRMVKQHSKAATSGLTRMWEWREMPGSGYIVERGLKTAVSEADQIAFDLLDSPSERVRRKAAEQVVYFCNRDARIWEALGSYMRTQPGGASVELGKPGERLIDFGLAEVYYARREYGSALKMLESAFGEDWAATGQIDKWWESFLPITKEDHLRFGYLFHHAGRDDRALREYRLAKGADRTSRDMRRAYAGAPAAPTTGGR